MARISSLATPLKSLVLFLVILAVPFDSSAQDRIEYGENWDEEGRFVAAWRDSFWVNDNGNDVEKRSEFQDGLGLPFWQGNRLVWEYDEDGNLIRTETYRLDRETKSIYELIEVQTTTFLEEGRIKDVIDMKRDENGEMQNHTRTRSVEDDQGRSVFRIIEFWQDGKWTAGFEIDHNRLLLSELTELQYSAGATTLTFSLWSINAQDFEPQYRRTDTTTESNGLIETHVFERWNGSGWEIFHQLRWITVESEDAGNFVEERTRQQLLNNVWQDLSRVRTVSNSSPGNDIFLTWSWNDSLWVPQTWTTNLLSGPEQKTSTSYNWDGITLSPRSRFESFFDAQGRETFRASSLFRNDRWNTIFSLETTYPQGVDVETTPVATDIDLQVYPNPTADRVRMDYAFPDRPPERVRIVDTSGRIVRDAGGLSDGSPRGSLEVDFSGLASGVYFILIDDGERLETRAVTKL